MIGELCLRFEIECGDAERKKKYHQIWEAHNHLININITNISYFCKSLTAEILVMHYCHFWIPLNTIECYWCFVECILFWQKRTGIRSDSANVNVGMSEWGTRDVELTSISLICSNICAAWQLGFSFHLPGQYADKAKAEDNFALRRKLHQVCAPAIRNGLYSFTLSLFLLALDLPFKHALVLVDSTCWFFDAPVDRASSWRGFGTALNSQSMAMEELLRVVLATLLALTHTSTL